MIDFLGSSLTVVSVIFSVVVFALFVRRLLGVRMGLLRTIVAAFIAGTLGPAVLEWILPAPEVGQDPLTLGLYVALLSGFVVIMAMAILVIIEALVPDGSLPGPLELWRSGRTRLSRTRRYLHILRVLAKHGLSRFLRGRVHRGVRTAPERRDLARSLRRALEDGGVTFVKLGQQLSTRRDLLPVEFTTELAALQDDAPPVPWDRVRRVLESELGRDIADVFESIDPEPLAAASVAQVHAARLLDGSEVVVKAQRPGISTEVERDLDIIARLARTLAARTEWGATFGLPGLVDGFSDALAEELDFTIESGNMLSVATALRAEGTAGVRVPIPRTDLCTPRVLVMERMAGIPLGAAEERLAALGAERRREVADTLLHVVIEQLLTSGIFHVDLHPGNLLVEADGTLAMLDLGSVGRLGSVTRANVGRLVAALGSGDSLAATDALLELVDRPEHVDERGLEQEIGIIILRFTTAGSTDGAAAFGALFRLVATQRLGIRPEVAAVFRAVATLEGTVTSIDPGYDLLGATRAAGASRIARELTPDAVRASVTHELATALPILRRLPRRADRLADAAEHGRLSLGVRLLADPRDRRFVTGLWHLALLALLGATAGLMSVVLFAVGPGPLVTPEIGVYHVLGSTLLCISVILVLRVLIVIFRRETDEG
ncbi:AarF/ABC1/UbiB kinase family protein [Occultella glacieicola]|uniref:AarF/ABC1/UbiB kinase family protein n=1 Tax=Occultella glacieicola TaxID=2518684 RepID=A0ABY2E8S0_9MICO|nr:AarF/UbiB family protein [Occultella glacieicola]TDE98909.1 AarF/ABC1/UbiB kinase family protein [Occultella glacieicola]